MVCQMTLACLLEQFFDGLRSREIRWCVLRNYERLPEENTGTDIDILIEHGRATDALHAIGALPGVAVTSIMRRPYVTSVFVAEVDGGCLQIDLITSLSWRGSEFIEAIDVLDRARRHPHCDWITVPDPIDEAIVSFLTSFLFGGFIKDRYENTYKPIFREYGLDVVGRLREKFSPGAAERLIESVAQGRRADAMRELGPIRRSLLQRGLVRSPLRTLVGLANHVVAEARMQFDPKHRYAIAVFGPDGAGKSALLAALAPRIGNCTKQLQLSHLRPRLPLERTRSTDAEAVADPHAKPSKPWLASNVQLLYWVGSYWWDYAFRRNRGTVLKIYDRYFHDVLVDPQRYRFGGSRSLALWLSRAVPPLDLAVFLDVTADVLRHRKTEVPPEETERQRAAYLALAQVVPNSLVVDGTGSLDEVVMHVKSGLIRQMTTRTARQLRSDQP